MREKRVTGVSYQFGFREVAYLLFGKKTCPACGHRMTKRRVSEIVTGDRIQEGPEWIFRDNQMVDSRTYVFDCLHCGRSHELKALAERK